MNLTQFNPLKCLAHADKIRDILNGKFPPPILVHLDLTNRCNFNCPWCYVKNYISNRIEMPFHIASKIINELVDYGVQSILFTGGGEPTLYPDFMKAVELAANQNVELGLTTNGTQLYKFADCLPLEKFKYVRVSFDAGCEETYMKVHGAKKGDFIRTLEGARAIALRKLCQVGLAYLVTPLNYRELPEALRWAENYDLDYISIRPTVFEMFLSEAQVKEAIEISNSLTSSSVNILRLNERFETIMNEERIACRSTPLIAAITADAKLTLCCQKRGESEFQWGDLSTESFKNLWGNLLHQTMLEKVKNEPCFDCTCRMRSYSQIIEKVFIEDNMHLGFL